MPEWRGKKISPYEGGHRVPFAIHWPAGGFNKHQPIDELTHMVDVLPTLLELCGVKPQPSKAIDGHSWMELLRPQGPPKFNWDTRIVISDSQRIQVPKKWKDSSVMSGKWRLINGKELYNIGDDPGQKKNVANQHPERMKVLRQWYEEWWAELEPTFSRTSDHYIGAPEQPEVVLTALQWIDVQPVWNQGMIRQGASAGQKGGARIGQKGGKKGKKSKKGAEEAPAAGTKPSAIFPGHWAVKVVQDGTYEFEVRRWPKESGLKIREGVKTHAPLPGCLPSFSNVTGRALPIVAATLRIDGKDLETKPVTDADAVVRFTHTLKTGQYKFSPYFTQQSKSGGAENRGLGCYYVTVPQSRQLSPLLQSFSDIPLIYIVKMGKHESVNIMKPILRILYLVLSLFASAASAQSADVDINSLLNEMMNRDAVARFPLQDFRLKQESSYDRDSVEREEPKHQPTGWFANRDSNKEAGEQNFLRIEENDGQKEWVLMDHQGPGALVRTWMPWRSEMVEETNMRIRIYLDGSDTPIFEGHAAKLLNGDGPFKYPFAHKSLRSAVSFFPIPYARSCKITTTEKPFFISLPTAIMTKVSRSRP